MATTNINVRVEEGLKAEAEELFGDLGISVSAAVSLYLKAAIRYQGIPFEIRRDSVYVTVEEDDEESLDSEEGDEEEDERSVSTARRGRKPASRK